MPDDVPDDFYHAIFRPWRYGQLKTGRPTKPPPDPTFPDYRDPYWTARYEHVAMLRAEGMTLRAIAYRLDRGPERVNQMIKKFGRLGTRKIRRARWRRIDGAVFAEGEAPFVFVLGDDHAQP
jgi:hypothetical protein